MSGPPAALMPIAVILVGSAAIGSSISQLIRELCLGGLYRCDNRSRYG
jgi:hypothetical protein